MAVNTVPEALRKDAIIDLHPLTKQLHVAKNCGTYPCPIFSYRVYFFFGSPILTIVPVGEHIEDMWFESRKAVKLRKELLIR